MRAAVFEDGELRVAEAVARRPITDADPSRLANNGEHRDGWQRSYTRDHTLDA